MTDERRRKFYEEIGEPELEPKPRPPRSRRSIEPDDKPLKLRHKISRAIIVTIILLLAVGAALSLLGLLGFGVVKGMFNVVEWLKNIDWSGISIPVHIVDE